ncbi:MAG: oxidoreductase [Planctomycetaceae bacterium]|nr:MAG: oxidoreductase [Planctomycetaceae bacterium]
MILMTLPWLEVACLTALLGSLLASRLRTPWLAWQCSLICAGGVLFCTLMAWTTYLVTAAPPTASQAWQQAWWGRVVFSCDALNAPLLSMLALLHFLIILATGRAKMRRFSSSWSLASEALRLAIFGCQLPSVLIPLLSAGTFLGGLELWRSGRRVRLYVWHMLLFHLFLLAGWFSLPNDPDVPPRAWSCMLLLAALLIRCGTLPFHCWVIDWFEQASLGNALLFITPLTGVYATCRLVLPIAPDWMLKSLGIFSLVTSVYAAAMATIQLQPRRWFAWLTISHASLVLMGLERLTVISLTGALALWMAVMLSLGGLGLTLRALEARVGHVSFAQFHGLYHHSPALAVGFLIMGLAAVGFPGTLGFVAAELLVQGTVASHIGVGLAVIASAALNGIAVLRAYFALFTGAQHLSTVSLAITPRERLAILITLAIIHAGGLFPQPGLQSRYQAAQLLLQQRSAVRHTVSTASTAAPTQRPPETQLPSSLPPP